MIILLKIKRPIVTYFFPDFSAKERISELFCMGLSPQLLTSFLDFSLSSSVLAYIQRMLHRPERTWFYDERFSAQPETEWNRSWGESSVPENFVECQYGLNSHLTHCKNIDPLHPTHTLTWMFKQWAHTKDLLIQANTPFMSEQNNIHLIQHVSDWFSALSVW